MTTDATASAPSGIDAQRFRELVEAAYAEAPRPLILNAYRHGGGRVVGLHPGKPGRERLVADFYEQANRDLFAFIEEHLRDLLALVERAEPETRA